MLKMRFIKWAMIIFFILLLILVLASLTLPSVTVGPTKSPIGQRVSELRQLFVLTQSANLDAETAGLHGVFPGDLSNSFVAWSNSLVPVYCSAQTFKLFLLGKEGKGKLTDVTIYSVSSSDPQNTVLFSTANVDATGLHDRPPFGLKGGALVTVGGSAVSIIATSPNSSSYTNFIWPKKTVKP